MSKPEREIAGESVPPIYLSEENSVEAVRAPFVNCGNPQLKAVMTSVIRHLHAVVKETEPTFQE